MGVLLALYQRDARGGEGQVIDVALYESLFNLSESLLPEYSAFGAVRQPAGGALPGIAPSNAYPCASGEYVLVAANGDAIFKRMMLAIGRADLADDPALERNDGRVQRVDEIDAAIAAWTRTQTVESALAVLRDAQVPSGRIYTVKDIAEDPHYRARGVIESVTSAGGLTVEVPGVVPKLSASPGAIHDRAPALGEHTDAVLKQAGFDDAAIADLRARKVIA
ncbi:MAG: CaiB/BaiF CoA transferase family protein, partial [Cupriavidus necator]